ncbi:DUF423 domain-containing protein [Deinococcus sp.]|uniref:DUF423 domain-containing protein n=1 Tax=Deinococcus sp. TaxID=47478 RepID=UPI003C7B93EF
MTTRRTTETGAALRGQTHTPALYGALLTGTGVALGAFGAHALKAAITPALLEVFETGVRYQTYHGLGLLALGALPAFQTGRQRAPALLLAGTLVFSGSLYLLSFTGLKWLGAVTPLGGLLLLAGWGLVVWTLWRGEKGGR